MALVAHALARALNGAHLQAGWSSDAEVRGAVAAGVAAVAVLTDGTPGVHLTCVGESGVEARVGDSRVGSARVRDPRIRDSSVETCVGAGVHLTAAASTSTTRRAATST